MPLVLTTSCGSLAIHADVPFNRGVYPRLWLLDRRDHQLWDGPETPSGLGLALLQMLNPEEQAHWSAHRFRADRDRSLLGRAALRSLLAQALNTSPPDVPLQRGPLGKPMLASVSGSALQFNLSHAGDLLLIGFHHHNPIGVDLESIETAQSIHASGDLLDIARHVFQPEIVDSITLLPFEQQPHAFLLQWCQLEAELKAHGTGLMMLQRIQRHQASLRQHNYSVVHYAITLPVGYIGTCSMIFNNRFSKTGQA